MDFTVYSMGDMPIFISVLNAVAMAFSSSMFNPAQGAGVVVIGLLLGIFYMIFPVTSGGKINPTPFIFALLLFWVGVAPKERVQIEDIYSGQVAAVDNVPLIVALPAALMASLSNAITNEVETSFSTTSGSYISMGAEGFVNPLKLLLSLRDPIKVGRSFPFMTRSITEFVYYCAPTDPSFNVKTMTSSPDVVAYLATLPGVHGITIYYNTANPLGFTTSCNQAQADLVIDYSNAVSGADMATVLQTSAGGEFAASNNVASSGATVLGVENAYNAITSGIMGLSQTSQQFMVNLVAFTPIEKGVSCINQPMGPNYAACTANMMQTQAMEQQKVDAAASASIFAKTVIPAMNILLALFYAFSPIVIAIAFMSGPNGIKLVVGFFMFGAWTQSWMPIAAVINYMIQLQVQYEFSKFPASGVTMENVAVFYNVLTMKIGIASELLAMTPMISFALLTGSMMALTGISQKWGGREYVDENQAAPSLATNDSLVKNASLMQGTPAYTAKNMDGKTVGDMMMTRDGNVNAFKTFEAGDNSTNARQEAQQRAESAAHDHSHAATRALMKKHTNADNQTDYSKVGKAFQKSNETAYQSARSYVEKLMEGTKLSDSTKEAMTGAVIAQWSSGKTVPGRLLEAATGASVSAQGKYELAAASERIKSVDSQIAQDTTNSNSEAHKLASTFQRSAGRDLAHSMGKELSDSGGTSYQDAFNASQSASWALQASQSRASMTGGKLSMTSQELAHKIQDKTKSDADISLFVGSQNTADQARYNSVLQQKEALLGKQGIATDDDAMRAAKLEALYEMSASGQDAMWSIAASRSGLTTAGTVGSLNADSQYTGQMDGMADTVQRTDRYADSQWKVAGQAERGSHGNFSTVSQNEGNRNASYASVMSDPSGVVTPPTSGSVPAPVAPNTGVEQRGEEVAEHTLASKQKIPGLGIEAGVGGTAVDAVTRTFK